MVNHSLNQGFVKCFIEDREDSEKMALTLLHSESGRASRGISRVKYRRNVFFQGLGKNDCLGHKFSTS